MSKIELIQIDENNYTIGESKIEFIENKTIHVTAVGELTYEIAKLYETLHYKLFQFTENKVNYLTGVSKTSKLSSKSLKIVKILKDLAFHHKVNKIAVYGVNPVTRVIIAFVIGLKPKNNMRLFDTKEQAISWLKE